MPVLKERFWMLGTQRTAENVWYVDWGMPHRMRDNAQLVQQMEHLCGVKGEGQILWECPDGDSRLLELARCRGFEIKPTMEFTSWLKKCMQDLVQARPNDGLHALARSLLKKP